MGLVTILEPFGKAVAIAARRAQKRIKDSLGSEACGAIFSIADQLVKHIAEPRLAMADRVPVLVPRAVSKRVFAVACSLELHREHNIKLGQPVHTASIAAVRAGNAEALRVHREANRAKHAWEAEFRERVESLDVLQSVLNDFLEESRSRFGLNPKAAEFSQDGGATLSPRDGHCAGNDGQLSFPVPPAAQIVVEEQRRRAGADNLSTELDASLNFEIESVDERLSADANWDADDECIRRVSVGLEPRNEEESIDSEGGIEGTGLMGAVESNPCADAYPCARGSSDHLDADEERLRAVVGISCESGGSSVASPVGVSKVVPEVLPRTVPDLEPVALHVREMLRHDKPERPEGSETWLDDFVATVTEYYEPLINGEEELCLVWELASNAAISLPL